MCFEAVLVQLAACAVKPRTLLGPPRAPLLNRPARSGARGAPAERHGRRAGGGAAAGKALACSPSEGHNALEMPSSVSLNGRQDPPPPPGLRGWCAIALARLRAWGLCSNAGGCRLPSALASAPAPNDLVAQPLISGMKFPADTAGGAAGRAPTYPSPAALPFVPSWLSVPAAVRRCQSRDACGDGNRVC